MQEGEGQSKSGRRKRIKYSSRKNMSIKNFKKSTKMQNKTKASERAEIFCAAKRF